MGMGHMAHGNKLLGTRHVLQLQNSTPKDIDKGQGWRVDRRQLNHRMNGALISSEQGTNIHWLTLIHTFVTILQRADLFS